MATCIAVGNVSLDDWPMLTWSFGCTGDLLPSVPPASCDGPVGDDLVGVHVGLRPGAGLPDVQREVLVEGAVGDLRGGTHDERPGVGIDAALAHVDLGAGQLEQAHGVHDLAGHALRARVADGEVVQRPLRLGTPVAVGAALRRRPSNRVSVRVPGWSAGLGGVMVGLYCALGGGVSGPPRPAATCQARARRERSCRCHAELWSNDPRAPVAQRIERLPPEQKVVGSSPAGRASSTTTYSGNAHARPSRLVSSVSSTSTTSLSLTTILS